MSESPSRVRRARGTAQGGRWAPGPGRPRVVWTQGLYAAVWARPEHLRSVSMHAHIQLLKRQRHTLRCYFDVAIAGRGGDLGHKLPRAQLTHCLYTGRISVVG